MSWSTDFGNAIAAVADTAGDVVATGLNSVSDGVGSVVETIGNAAADAAGAAADAAKDIPVVGGLLGGAAAWVGAVASAGFQFLAMTVRGVGNVVANAFGGGIKFLGGALAGLLTGDFSVAAEGLGDFALAVFGAALAIAGTFVALVQTAITAQRPERRLSDFERGVIVRVYRKSLALENLRVIEGQAGIFSTNDRPFTLGNRIYMKDYEAVRDIHVLVHECCHVWQHQHEGTRYIGSALWAQGTLADAYDWSAELSAGKTEWKEFNREAQAEFIESVHRGGARVPSGAGLGQFYEEDPVGPGVVFTWSGKDLTDFARESIAYLRAA